MRYLVSLRDGQLVPKTTQLWYVIGSLISVLIEFTLRRHLNAAAVILFGVFLYLHEFIVAREIEYIRPYSATMVGKHLAHIEEVAFNYFVGCYWILKYSLLFLGVPAWMWLRGTQHQALVYIGSLSCLLIASDIKRISSILKQVIVGAGGRLYINILVPLVASYASFILSFTILYSSAYLHSPFLFTGNLTSPVTVDFFYFNAITFTTLGYGDIVPSHWMSKLVVSVENILSYVMFAFTISAVAKLLAKEQEDAPVPRASQAASKNDNAKDRSTTEA